jgi:hypothetical protein
MKTKTKTRSKASKGKRMVARVLMEWHEYECPFWRLGKRHGPCRCKSLRAEAPPELDVS